MFYLTYRPKNLEEIDNQEIRSRISSLLQSGKLPHAFLFTGQKGIGKTSLARIIAKAINCEKTIFAKNLSSQKEKIDACGICASCKLITSGYSPDVVEIDGASHRRIDDVRSLIETVKFAPLYGRCKVYIIDEVHMMTEEAFNALLKTLEEPPPSTIFMLATTDKAKVPKTILSRCVLITFHKATHEEIVGMLTRIVHKEKIKIDKEALERIAEFADASFRDAAKIIEELSVQKTHLTVSHVEKLMGVINLDEDLLVLIAQKKGKDALMFIEEYVNQGGETKRLIEELLDKLHAFILKKNGIEVGSVVSYELTLKQSTSLIKLFQEAYVTVKYSPIESLPLELAIVEYCAV